MLYSAKECKGFVSFIRKLIISERKRFTGRTNQTLIKEYIGSYSKHDSYKIRLARNLGYEGKKVFVEKYINPCVSTSPRLVVLT